MIDFRSDNTSGAAPEVMQAILRANEGRAGSYGADELSAALDERFGKLFGHACRVFPIATGTAANTLALASLTPAWGAIYCLETSHLAEDECNAAEFMTGGARLVTFREKNGKLDPADLKAHLSLGWQGVQHHPQPVSISITQASEAGTLYKPDEIATLGKLAREHNLRLHMDGARFANAVAALNASAADLTWKGGVDALTFGASKNGALAAEAVIFFDPALAENFLYRRKRAGHLFSKMRFLSAQLLAMLEDDLWLKLARQANARARALAEGLGAIPGVSLAYPAEANEVFAWLTPQAEAGLKAAEVGFYPRPILDKEGRRFSRFVCSFETSEADIEGAVRAAR